MVVNNMKLRKMASISAIPVSRVKSHAPAMMYTTMAARQNRTGQHERMRSPPMQKDGGRSCGGTGLVVLNRLLRPPRQQVNTEPMIVR